MTRNEDANPLPGPVEYAIPSRRRIREDEEDALRLGPRKKAYVLRFAYHILSGLCQTTSI